MARELTREDRIFLRWGYSILAFIIVAFVVVMLLGMKHLAERRIECQEQGGVLVKTYGGNECVDADTRTIR